MGGLGGWVGGDKLPGVGPAVEAGGGVVGGEDGEAGWVAPPVGEGVGEGALHWQALGCKAMGWKGVGPEVVGRPLGRAGGMDSLVELWPALHVPLWRRLGLYRGLCVQGIV